MPIAPLTSMAKPTNILSASIRPPEVVLHLRLTTPSLSLVFILFSTPNAPDPEALTWHRSNEMVGTSLFASSARSPALVLAALDASGKKHTMGHKECESVDAASSPPPSAPLLHAAPEECVFQTLLLGLPNPLQAATRSCLMLQQSAEALLLSSTLPIL